MSETNLFVLAFFYQGFLFVTLFKEIVRVVFSSSVSATMGSRAFSIASSKRNQALLVA